MADVAFHPFQLTNVWASRVAATRREARTGEERASRLEPSRGRRLEVLADGLGFRCEVAVAVILPVLDEELFEARVTLVGHFATEYALPKSVIATFAREQALYLLWPFARSYIDALAMMAGVSIPPLPLLLVRTRSLP